MRRSFIPILIVSSLTSSAIACSGGEKSRTNDDTAEKTVEKAVETPPEPEMHENRDQGEGIAWADKTHEQKKAYMGQTVKPHMAELFTAFDADHFKDFKCSTCHGDNAKERDFKMPNPDLPKLENFEKLKAEKPEAMNFMMKRVVPEMAKLLDQQPFDPETKTGFGCSGCHPH